MKLLIPSHSPLETTYKPGSEHFAASKQPSFEYVFPSLPQTGSQMPKQNLGHLSGSKRCNFEYVLLR